MKITAACHCGAVELTGDAPAGLDDAARCNCSFCKRRQAANIGVTSTTLKVTKGADNLGLYSFGTHTAQHYFCKTCGIYTHHQTRSNPLLCGVNLGCIRGAHPLDHEPIPWRDGINHPSDQLEY
ncbi:MAG: hypothetical protein ACI9PY_002500 [Ascidiaceihabitans sp.]|jgi:hypothetical protein